MYEIWEIVPILLKGLKGGQNRELKTVKYKLKRRQTVEYRMRKKYGAKLRNKSSGKRNLTKFKNNELVQREIIQDI